MCPNCEVEGDVFHSFRPLQRPKRYERELNLTYQHVRHRGGCGHIFSPGEPWIIEAFLSGDLVHRSSLDAANETVRILRSLLAGKENISEEDNSTDERRVETR